MSGVKLLTGNNAVLKYMVEHPALCEGGVTPSTILLLPSGTLAGRCAVSMHVQIDGRDRLVSLTLDTFQLVAEVMRAAAETQYKETREP